MSHHPATPVPATEAHACHLCDWRHPKTASPAPHRRWRSHIREVHDKQPPVACGPYCEGRNQSIRIAEQTTRRDATPRPPATPELHERVGQFAAVIDQAHKTTRRLLPTTIRTGDPVMMFHEQIGHVANALELVTATPYQLAYATIQADGTEYDVPLVLSDAGYETLGRIDRAHGKGLPGVRVVGSGPQGRTYAGTTLDMGTNDERAVGFRFNTREVDDEEADRTWSTKKPVWTWGDTRKSYPMMAGVDVGDLAYTDPGGHEIIIGKVVPPDTRADDKRKKMVYLQLVEDGAQYEIPILMHRKAATMAAEEHERLAGRETMYPIMFKKPEEGEQSTVSQPRKLSAAATEYSRALDCQLTLHEWVGTDLGQRVMRQMMDRGGTKRSEHYSLWAQAVRYALRTAETFYVAPWICDMLMAVAPNMPNQSLQDWYLPSDSGFVYFDKPLRMPPLPVDDPMVTDDIQAMSWTRITQEYDPALSRSNEFGIMLVFYARSMGGHMRGKLLPSVTYSWLFGMNQQTLCDEQGQQEAALDGVETEDNHEYWTRHRRLRANYVMAFLTFVSQRILIPSDRERTTRSTTKRVEGVESFTHEPLVRIMEYRQKQYTRKAPDPNQHEFEDNGYDQCKRCGLSKDLGLHTRDWDGYDCWFMVGDATGGFWRTYHEKDGDVVKWILPFAKGDRTKPFRPKPTTINVVLR
jgi:hypothetical protein